MSIRIGIVEDDALLRTTLLQSLGATDDFEVLAASATGEQILDLARDSQLDVALLDVHLGVGPTGFDVAKSLRQVSPLVGIVFLSTVKDPRLLGQQPAALPQGAHYLLKSDISNIDILANALKQAASDSLQGPSAKPPSSPFTESQIEILRLVAAGHSNSSIATERVVTEHAVEMAVSRLAKHLGLQETPGLNQRVHIARTFFREMGWGG